MIASCAGAVGRARSVTNNPIRKDRMDLSSLETSAAISKYAVVALASGGVVAGYVALYFAAKKNDKKRLQAQFVVVALTAFGVFAGYSVYFFTDEINMERERLAKGKDAELERFKVEKTAEITSASARSDTAITEGKRIESEASVKISEAKAIAAKANERAQGLENENLKLKGTVATLQERAAKAEKDLLEVQERLAWRDLSVEQQARILAKLKKHSGAEFDIRVFQEPEALRFLNIMIEILHSAGWIQRPVDAAFEITTKYGVAGVSLSGGVIVRNAPSHPELREAANALATALVAEGIAAKTTQDGVERNPERIHIAIGKK